jgi:hypothetical protein
VDWDDLAWRIAGPEGGLRYFRMGIVLVVLGIIAMAAIGFTPIFQSDDTSMTYDVMAEDPDSSEAFGVPNSQVLAHANWALVGAGLTILMGLILILEGKRVINLRRLLAWHAEARATALFSLAAMVASIGLFAGASLLGLAESMPSSSGEGVTVVLQASSPAAIVVVLTMGLATGGMLGLAYYNNVLSVYRGGGDPTKRRMARAAMGVAALSLAGILLLRVGIIMWAVIQMAFGPDAVFDVQWYYTMSRIDYQATLGAGEETKGTLSWQLTITSALLFLSFMAAMAGLIGGSARSLGGSSLRVRRAAALPVTAVLMVGIALLMMAWAATTAPEAARESWGIDDLEVNLGWGLMASVVMAMGAMASCLAYLKGLGIGFAREALAFWKRPEPSEEVAVEDGIPQPMVEQALAEEAMARGETPPPKPGPDEYQPPFRERLLLRNAMRKEVIFGILVVVIILLAVLWPDGGGGDNGNGDPGAVAIEELPVLDWTISISDYLAEGSTLDQMAFEDLGAGQNDLYFIDTVQVTVVWADEDDAGFLWTNTPDGFGVSISDGLGLDDPDTSGTNPQGGRGTISATWSTGGPWVAYGNTDLVRWGDQDVITMEELIHVDISVIMESAGDQVTPLGRTQNDSGNTFTMTIDISGHIFSVLEEGQ